MCHMQHCFLAMPSDNKNCMDFLASRSGSLGGADHQHHKVELLFEKKHKRCSQLPQPRRELPRTCRMLGRGTQSGSCYMQHKLPLFSFLLKSS